MKETLFEIYQGFTSLNFVTADFKNSKCKIAVTTDALDFVTPCKQASISPILFSENKTK